jgi:hypothetical protein
MLIYDKEVVSIARQATRHDGFQQVATNRRGRFFSRPRNFQLSAWAVDVREMLNDLADLEFSSRQASPLQKLCEAGANYGLAGLGKTVSYELLSLLGPQVKWRMKRDLRRILVRATRPCFVFQFNAFCYAFQAVYAQQGLWTLQVVEKKFLGERPYDRLILLFKDFPVLAELWSRLIRQWSNSVSEFLARVAKDKPAIFRAFFSGKPLGKIIELHTGLSDPHNNGRTVMRARFRAGSVIYKPRSGGGEEVWFRLISHLNRASLRPKLTAAQVLGRDGYCWMQEVKFAPCNDRAAVRRFYKRLGAMIAAAYLLRAVDCHRDNVIASGEHPVLIDAETLWHIAGEERAEDLLDPLYRTGFLPTSGRRSTYQYQSSVLGRTQRGRHIPFIASNPLGAARYEVEIVDGFRQAWCCLLGTRARRAAFNRHLLRIQRLKRRQLYLSTVDYDTILQASIQPAALRSGVDRNTLIARLCRRAVSRRVIRGETNALKRLDIPYFVGRATAQFLLPVDSAAPPKIIEALRRAMRL